RSVNVTNWQIVDSHVELQVELDSESKPYIDVSWPLGTYSLKGTINGFSNGVTFTLHVTMNAPEFVGMDEQPEEIRDGILNIDELSGEVSVRVNLNQSGALE